ncbi:arginase [bacterium]|nr:MAG: arginase [bacterium]
MLETKRVEIIGVPMDLGASRRGVDMGPSAVRYASLGDRLRSLGLTVVDRGNVFVPVRESVEQATPSARFLGVIEGVCGQLAEEVSTVLRYSGFPIVIGGDHSIALGTLRGIKNAHGRQPGVIWIDAHADINTPATSASGNVHGMPLGLAIERGIVDPAHVVLIGLRDVDPPERELIRHAGIKAYSMSEVDRMGIESIITTAIARVTDPAHPADAIHVTFDMDAIDPSEAPGTGTPVRGGLSYRESHLAMELLAASGRLGSLEVTEINPILDVENRTAKLAVELILSALGKTIL